MIMITKLFVNCQCFEFMWWTSDRGKAYSSVLLDAPEHLVVPQLLTTPGASSKSIESELLNLLLHIGNFELPRWR